MIPAPQHVALAADLRLAAETRTPVDPQRLRDRLAATDINGAYDVQQVNTHHWLQAGRRGVGWKLGFTGTVIQQAYKAPGPDYGVLFADMERGNDSDIGPHEVMQPMAEAEVALILARDITANQATLADVIPAIGWVVPAIEIIGSRVRNWDIRYVDAIADNASSGLYVLGGPVRPLEGLDLIGSAVGIEKNGVAAGAGEGRLCLGSPLNAVAWLARELGRRGLSLRAGELVLTGSLGPVVKVAAGDKIVATIAGLGSVAVSFS